MKNDLCAKRVSEGQEFLRVRPTEFKTEISRFDPLCVFRLLGLTRLLTTT
jgi:hypothetical protein